MRRTRFTRWPCSIARTVDILGDWWTPIVLREAFYGVRRFDEFQSSLHLSRNVLAQRLSRLVDEGIFDRLPYAERPARFEYVLTEKGRDLFGVLSAMSAWGDRWLDGGDGAPILFHHLTCHHDAKPQVVCDQCHQQLRLDDVRPLLGPGYPERLRARALQTGRFGPL
jgi:DNA-binding HxlR family transcriptional regulator